MSNKNISSAARLPRKQKKQVKKIVARKYANKMAMSAVVTAQAIARNAIIVATPGYAGKPGIAFKTLSVAQNVISAAKSVQQIMSEPPNSWKEFIEPKTAFASL